MLEKQLPLHRQMRWVLVLSLLCAQLAASAQVSRYLFSQSTAAYVPITGGTVAGAALANMPPGPNSLSGTVYYLPANTIPFSFEFNGSAYTEFSISSGSYLTFGPYLPVPRNTQLPGSQLYYDVDHPLSQTVGTGFDGVIAPMVADILGSTTPGMLGEIRYQTLGTAPNRVFVVQWSQMRFYTSASGLLNYQIRLHETTNVIEFAYGLCQASPATSVQVGLRGSNTNDWHNRTGTWVASTPGSTNTATLTVGPTDAPPTGLTYRFTPPAPQPCPVPFSLAAVPGGTQARLSWRAAAPSTGPYTLVYGLAGFNPATGGLGTRTGLTGTSTSITGLTPSTEYEFYVTQNCGGAAGSSPVSSPAGRFRTTILNDEPVDATPLPVASPCQPVNSSTAGATRTVANGYDPLVDCNNFSPVTSDADVWFSVTTDATGPASRAMQITATVPASTSLVRVRVFSSANGPAGPFTQLYCQANPTNSGVFAPFILANLTPSTTYYLLVDNGSEFGPKGPFSICATVPPACGDATSIVEDYRVTTPSSSFISFQGAAGATSYLATLVPQAPAGGATLTFTLPGNSTSFTFTGLSPATTYAGTLQAQCANGGLGAAVPFVVNSRPVNDALTDAIVLPVTAGCQPVAGSTRNSFGVSPAITPTPSGCGLAAFRDVWYRFTTPLTGPAATAVRVEVTGAPASQVRVYERISNAGNNLRQLGCSGTANNVSAPLLDLIQLTPGTEYYVQVGHFGNPYINGGPFTICITEPPTCGTPRNLAVGSITATTATITYTAGQPAATVGYAVTLKAQGNPPITLSDPGTGGTIPLTGLQPGTYYSVSVQSNCGTGGLSLPAPTPPLFFRTPGPPANATCATAEPLACAQGTARGMLTGATATGQPTTTCGGSAPLGPGVWYQLAGTGQNVTLSFCTGYPDDPDLQLLVYTGTCGSLQCVGSNDNSTACQALSQPRMPTLTFATATGQTYYVLVVDTGRPLPFGTPSSGEFDMFINCAAPTACPAPTGLSVVQLGSNTATAGWTPDPSASAYQVVWQPLNSATLPVVANVTVPPATTTQLLPNTPYMVTVSSICGTTGLRSVSASAQFTTLLGARQPVLDAQVELYPNPAHQQASVLVPLVLRGPAPVSMILYNALGQAVRTLELPATGPLTSTFDLQGLPTGAYLLRLPTVHGVISKRLLVE